MSKSSPILGQYEVIAGITRRMLAQARANQWDEVVALSEEYQAAVEWLRSANLSDEDRVARKDLLEQILDDDASIRLLAAPELSRLGVLLGNMKRQHSVLQAYSAPPLNS